MGGGCMEQKKILYCASTISHLRNFHLPYMQKLQELGYAVTACANEHNELPFADDVKVIPFYKQITSPENIKNIVRVYRLLKQEQYTAISVHTTLAAAVVRAAVLLLPKKKRPKVVYTCHGYLFGKKDGIKKWKYLLPEKVCSGVTDVLLVMNQEDKVLAEQHKLYNVKNGKLCFIPGMGVNFKKFDIPQNKVELRQRYGVTDDAVLYVFAGEFSERKNQKVLIDAFSKVEKQMPNAKLILAGTGALLDECKQQVEQLHLQEKIIFPGHVNQMPVLYRMCDVCVSASKIEGLPFNIMEAMYCQLPCVVSNIKGHQDLITQGQTGYLCSDAVQMSETLLQTYQSKSLRQRLGVQAKDCSLAYTLENVLPVIQQVYEMI